MARTRKPESELTRSICINLKQKVLDELEKEGKPKNVIERIINEKYLGKFTHENIDKS